MIEFTLNRNRNGKKSRWAKKYPRKRILKRGSEKAAGWYFHNWYDDGYHYFHGDLHKFLLKNVGRPVDKVFSEFLQRCRRGTEKYNLREWFYDMFEEKENIDYRGGFYLSNGIINYKKRSKRPRGSYTPSPFILQYLNTQNLPSKRELYNICKKAEETHKKELIAATIPATEHSVMCAGGKEDELETFRRLITEVYPTGFVSIVSDTWDFWKVMTEYLPKLKDKILARDGRLVIRPDSGDPVHIIAGYKHEDFETWQEQTEVQDRMSSTAEWVGAYQVLWDIFGGTVNEKGYKVLNPKVGIIYGDSITLERQKEIYKRLEERGFAATNLVLGVGSYTYQYKSRDSLGFAMKATWCQVNGEGREIFKDPKTDDGTKKSLKGLICVQGDGDKYVAEDQVSKEQEEKGYLQTVFEDGKLVKEWTLSEIRSAVDRSIVYEDI